jgi:uncharacterized protein (TIGR02145 family)
MIDVCHNTGNGNWHTINININALPEHLSHGDIVPDADGDGHTKVNPCGNGSQDDCDDNNPAIYPGNTELCNNIDDNCNGQVDENCIPAVTICNQIWMLNNLDVNAYRNGDPIPEVTDPSAWAALTTGAWCWYENNAANGTTYGKLYNWYAVNDPRGLAPAGWHIPTDAEWVTLSDCLGGTAVAGGVMKETGTTHWTSPNADATNSSGFTGLPGGYRFADGSFQLIGNNAFWWSATEYSTTNAWDHFVYFGLGNIGRDNDNKKDGFSIRCIRD